MPGLATQTRETWDQRTFDVYLPPTRSMLKSMEYFRNNNIISIQLLTIGDIVDPSMIWAVINNWLKGSVCNTDTYDAQMVKYAACSNNEPAAV